MMMNSFPRQININLDSLDNFKTPIKLDYSGIF